AGKGATVADQPERIPDVVRLRDVFLDLVELAGINGDETVLFPVDEMRLKRRVELVEVDGCRICAELLKQRGEYRRDRHANTIAVEIRGRFDRLAARGDLSKTVIGRLGDDYEAGLLDLSSDVGAEASVHRGPDLIVGGKHETDIRDRRGRGDGGQHRARDVEELDPAGAHLGKQVGIGPELARREEPDLQAAAGC